MPGTVMAGLLVFQFHHSTAIPLPPPPVARFLAYYIISWRITLNRESSMLLEVTTASRRGNDTYELGY